MPQHRPWTAGADKRLLANSEAGELSLRQIAEGLGRSETSARLRLLKLRALARAAVATVALSGCFTDAVGSGGSGDDTGSTTVEIPSSGPTGVTGATGSTSSSASGSGTTGAGSTGSELETGSTGGTTRGSTGGDGSSGSTGADLGPYRPCEDGCSGSCVFDATETMSACAPDCDPGCPDGGTCLADVADVVAAPVCFLDCTAGSCPEAMTCAPTTYTNTEGTPISACVWPA